MAIVHVRRIEGIPSDSGGNADPVSSLVSVTETKPHIGTLREKPLHASLKHWYCQEGDAVEVPVDGFVIDLVRDDLLIEIQTRGFSSMKRKVTDLIEAGHRVRIVYPVPLDKWIVKVDNDGEVQPRRLSPKHGDVTDVFAELVSFPTLVAEADLEVEVILVREEEYRLRTENRSWRRNGWSIEERRLVEVVGSQRIGDVEDLAALLPDGLPGRFTTAHLASSLGRPRRLAQQMTYCLRLAGVLTIAGKQGNAVEYTLA